MRHKAKVDTTHPEIVDALRKAGCSVLSLATVGAGVPDLLVSYQGFTALCECKTGKAILNEAQSEFARKWQGTVFVANTPEMAVEKFFAAWAVSRLAQHGSG